MQDTLIKVWNKRDELQDIDSIEAYSLAVCRNIALDRLKKKDRQSESIDTIHLTLYDGTASPYEQIDQKDRLQIVKNIVNALPEKQRSCIQLRDIEGKSYRDIATILDITEQQVKVNIFRARQTIKEKFMKIK